jgi:prepilin-type N-terminal cleavage/methylation domain-containing protein
MKKKSGGFTLIELLVVIAIIGLLSTLAVVTFIDVRKRARDARYVTDVKAIQKAAELYYGDYGYYPWSPSSNAWVATESTATYKLDAILPAEYLPELPEPISSRPSASRHIYYRSDDGTWFKVYFYPEVTDILETDHGCINDFWYCIGEGPY